MKNSKIQTNSNIQNSKFETRNSDTTKAYSLVVSGDVQGVSYRYFAKKEANSLGLSGWAKNEHNGTVLMFVQGAREALEQFIEWSKVGSPMAEVEKVDTKEAEADNSLIKFEVR